MTVRRHFFNFDLVSSFPHVIDPSHHYLLLLWIEPTAKKSKLVEEEEIEIDEGLKVQINPLDRDDDDSESERGDKSDDSSDSDSDDDAEEIAEIQRQIERLKRERQEEKERKEKVAAEELERERAARMAGANPLMAHGDDEEGGQRVAVKKWFEETIFKNQAQGEQRYKKRVINDTVRNDFQKRFMDRYVH